MKTPGGELGDGLELCGFGGREGFVLFEVFDLLRDVFFEEGEVGSFEIVDWVLLAVGDDYVDYDQLGTGAEGDAGVGWLLGGSALRRLLALCGCQ